MQVDRVPYTKKIEFYILWPGNTEEDCAREMNQVGVEYYNKKYTDNKNNVAHIETSFSKREGYYLLERAIIEEREDLLKNTRIFNSNGKQFSIEDLFDRINKSLDVK